MKGGKKVNDFEEIYEKYFKDVYKYILSLSRNVDIAEEITQETFYKALKSIDDFKGQSSLYVWLCQIGKNSYFTYLKKKDNRLINIDQIEELPYDGFENSILMAQDLFELHKLIHKLDEPYKEVFMLRYFGELAFSKIGELFNKTESWARVTYHRARLKLKENLI